MSQNNPFLPNQNVNSQETVQTQETQPLTQQPQESAPSTINTDFTQPAPEQTYTLQQQEPVQVFDESQNLNTSPILDNTANIQTQAFTPDSFTQNEQSTQQIMSGIVTDQTANVVPPINQQLNLNAMTLKATKSVTPQPEVKEQTQVVTTAPVINTPPPALEDGQTIIAQLSPGAFDSFIKVLSLLDEKNIINITKSNILQLINNNSAILQTNIQQLVGNKEIDLHILQPKVNIKLFKAIKDNNDVFIIDDPNNKRFQVISGEVRIWLPKQIEEIQPEVAAPTFSTDQCIGKPIFITKEERTKITTLMSGSTSITLLVKDNQLKGYLIPERVEAAFKCFAGEKISENNADLKLMSSAFLNIPSDGDTIVTLANQNGNYWMMSKINTAMVEIIIIESLQIAQNDQLLL